MAIFANEFPSDFVPGSDFVQIEDEEFALASEPQGLIAIDINDESGYLTLASAKRLLAALAAAVANSEAPRDGDGEWNIEDARAGKYDRPATDDDKIPF